MRAPETSDVSAGGRDGSWPGPLSSAVAQLCSGLRDRVDEDTATAFGEVLRRLSAPLQLAVAGRIKSGKSTLVNALIGRRVAPTDVGECTRLVTRFQYGTVDRVEVVLRDGGTRALPFDADGGIPADLGVEPERISHLEAYLTNAVLRDLTVIDTPGLGSAEPDAGARTEEVLNPQTALDPVSRSAVAGAEAVLYVVAQGARADDRQALSAFRAATAGREAGPGNALAVLNKADVVEPDSVRGSEDDVWSAAALLAQRQAELLRPAVTEVLPVIGLLAETAETDAFRAADAEVLHRLAALDVETRQMLLLSADLFTGWECDVAEADRAALLERMDLYGVRCALEAIDAEPGITAGDLRRRLLEASGVRAVVARLESAFRSRADGVKAAAGLASVSALAETCGDPAVRRCVHDAIEALLAEPDAHQLRVLEALTLVSCGEVSMPDDLTEEVIRVGSGTAVDERLGLEGRGRQELVDYALERAGWWRSFASFGATPAQSRIAHVVHRAYFLIWQQLKAADGAVR